ncbi:hypothetical protein FK220_006745 [Flavobacteriaceae bacterium TP-CH-4]|uniref:Uncharacterized protein n=1 Tax=Pelagihabitans pacificus TaxID=2696054 RepID=A0A967AT97_9FLAO|nr:hypothetical protein [Pelagihabitans pacificus]NHF59030.1 hypothetical protein [Pelagihabitans pacificus]
MEGRQFSEADEQKWMVGASMGPEAREQFRGKPIMYDLEIWDDARRKTLERLRTKDDESVNHHWAWHHGREHQTNHKGPN